MKSEPRIAFVIDALPSLGGGERVLFTALEIFPQAELFTLVYNQEIFSSTPIAQRTIKTSFLDSIPLARKHHRLFLPFMPFAMERFNLRAFDIIVSFSYAVANGVKNLNGAQHASYTYTPMRYAWTDIDLRGIRSKKVSLLSPLLHSFREWDRKAASRVHRFAAISHVVSQRIADAYGREAAVIYPPVDVGRFAPARRRENFYITVTRLVPHKRIDLLVRAFSLLNLPLLIVGQGPEMTRLASMAKPNVHFLGYQPDQKVAELLGKARGFVCATEEDFGIAMVEAQAAGCPVIAYGQGGAVETVVAEKTGIFFPEQSSASLINALQQFECTHASFHTPELQQNARKFDRQVFIPSFREFVHKTR